MVHPCYWVNHHSPHYCLDDSDISTCWTIDLCHLAFADFNPNISNMPGAFAPNKPTTNLPIEPIFPGQNKDEDKYGLNATMNQIHEIILDKIEQVTQADHVDYKRELVRKANDVQQQRISFNQATDELLSLIQSLPF